MDGAGRARAVGQHAPRQRLKEGLERGPRQAANALVVVLSERLQQRVHGAQRGGIRQDGRKQDRAGAVREQGDRRARRGVSGLLPIVAELQRARHAFPQIRGAALVDGGRRAGPPQAEVQRAQRARHHARRVLVTGRSPARARVCAAAAGTRATARAGGPLLQQRELRARHAHALAHEALDEVSPRQPL